MGRKKVWNSNKGKQRHIHLAGGVEAGFAYEVRIAVYRNGNVQGITFRLSDKEDMRKKRIRYKDRMWCYGNIPSSIMWKCEIHHDWVNNGTMYLLSKEEHLGITRRERNEKQRKG